MYSFRLPRVARTTIPFIMLAAASSLSSPHVAAQGLKADYERSASLVKNIENKIYRQSISPHWLEGNSKFWYRIDTAPGKYEFVLVDAKAGTRKAAFDHAKLATALGTELKKTVEPTALPFTWIVPSADGKLVRFRSDNKLWQFDSSGKLKPSDVEIAEERLEPIRRRRPSQYFGDRTAITFVNRLEFPVTLVWIDPDNEEKTYQTIQPGDLSRVSTFPGNVWMVRNPEGRAVGYYAAIADEAQVILEPRGANNAPKPQTEAKTPPEPAVKPEEPKSGRAFVKDFNLWVKTSDGKETQITTTGKADNYFSRTLRVSPNGRYVAVSQVVPEQEHKVYIVDSSPRDQVQPKLLTLDYLKPGDRVEQNRVRLFDLETKSEIPTSDALFTNQWSIDDMGWTEDGTAYRFLFNQRGHQKLRVLDMSVTGEVKPVIEESSPTFIDYSQKTYYHAVPGKNELIWASERDGWNHLYLYDTKTAKVKNQITKGNWVMREVERVDDEKRQIWFRAFGIVPGQDPYYAQLARINFDGSGLTVLTEGDGNHSWKWSPDGKYITDTYSRPDAPPVMNLRDGSSGKLITALEKADIAPLLETGWTMPERFEAKGRDGVTSIYGVIVRPSNFDPTKKYPVIENIYAGPQDFFAPKSFGTLNRFHELAELGFVAVQIDGMGTNWRSKAFHDVCYKNLKDAGFPDRIAWLKAAQTTRPWMDISKVGIYGGSAGGQNAMGALLFHGDFYKAAVADSGCHDNRMDKIWWNEAWMGFPVDKSYEDSSNVVHAKNLTGNLMLIYGEMDTNVDPASTMQVVNALVKAGKDFELLPIPGGGHGPGGSEYGRRRQNDFFVRSLLGVQPPSRNAS